MFGEKRPNYPFNYRYSGQMMHNDPSDQQWNHQHLYRNQPYPYQTQQQNYNWSSYQQQGSYFPQQYQPFGQNYQPGFVPPNMPYTNQQYPQKDGQFLFKNPLQPQDDMVQKQQYKPMNGYPMMNPYPKQSAMPKQPGGVQSFMNSFKSQDGSVDVNKMVNTAGQMVNAVSQVSSLVKGFGGFFKV